ncbi:hypothetical protein NEAUS06_0454 [Nematocida ausubeli]|nr:hypothetical protein NEAUS06_0454 [Nematocida ausubeli]
MKRISAYLSILLISIMTVASTAIPEYPYVPYNPNISLDEQNNLELFSVRQTATNYIMNLVKVLNVSECNALLSHVSAYVIIRNQSLLDSCMQQPDPNATLQNMFYTRNAAEYNPLHNGQVIPAVDYNPNSFEKVPGVQYQPMIIPGQTSVQYTQIAPAESAVMQPPVVNSLDPNLLHYYVQEVNLNLPVRNNGLRNKSAQSVLVPSKQQIPENILTENPIVMYEKNMIMEHMKICSLQQNMPCMNGVQTGYYPNSSTNHLNPPDLNPNVFQNNPNIHKTLLRTPVSPVFYTNIYPNSPSLSNIAPAIVSERNRLSNNLQGTYVTRKNSYRTRRDQPNPIQINTCIKDTVLIQYINQNRPRHIQIITCKFSNPSDMIYMILQFYNKQEYTVISWTLVTSDSASRFNLTDTCTSCIDSLVKEFKKCSVFMFPLSLLTSPESIFGAFIISSKTKNPKVPEYTLPDTHECTNKDAAEYNDSDVNDSDCHTNNPEEINKTPISAGKNTANKAENKQESISHDNKPSSSSKTSDICRNSRTLENIPNCTSRSTIYENNRNSSNMTNISSNMSNNSTNSSENSSITDPLLPYII